MGNWSNQFLPKTCRKLRPTFGRQFVFCKPQIIFALGSAPTCYVPSVPELAGLVYFDIRRLELIFDLTPAMLETSQDFGSTGGRAKAGFLPHIQKPATTRLIRPDGFNQRISA
jgi:hypothetical protein